MKPNVFNYQDYVKAQERIKELEAKVEKQMWDVMDLKEQNTNLRIAVRILKVDLDAERAKK